MSNIKTRYLVDEVIPTDDKGRYLAETLTDRGLMEEILVNQRAMMDLVRDFMGSMESNPMMKTLGRMMGGR